jgi:hypothetical protein
MDTDQKIVGIFSAFNRTVDLRSFPPNDAHQRESVRMSGLKEF